MKKYLSSLNLDETSLDKFPY